VARHELDQARRLLRRGRLSANYRPVQLWDLPMFAESTLLHLAVTLRHVDMVELLLQHGANPLAADRDGRTPMALAERARAVYADVAERMLEAMRRRVPADGRPPADTAASADA
jgi:ankyrin repeat protein